MEGNPAQRARLRPGRAPAVRGRTPGGVLTWTTSATILGGSARGVGAAPAAGTTTAYATAAAATGRATALAARAARVAERRIRRRLTREFVPLREQRLARFDGCTSRAWRRLAADRAGR